MGVEMIPRVVLTLLVDKLEVEGEMEVEMVRKIERPEALENVDC